MLRLTQNWALYRKPFGSCGLLKLGNGAACSGCAWRKTPLAAAAIAINSQINILVLHLKRFSGL
jgi:hypothetical protein